MGWIIRAWRGEERLWKVFWIYGFLLAGGISTVAEIIKITLGVKAYLFFWIPRVFYFIWLAVAEWRCAFNASTQFWGYLIRIGVVMSLLAAPLVMVGGMAFFALLLKTAQCSEDLDEYVAKGGKDIEGFRQKCPEQPFHGASKPAPTPDAASLLPPVKPDVVPADQEKYKQLCEKTMTDYAQKMGADPKQYIAKNLAYVQQCVQYYINQNTGLGHKE
jgi:hypothetical protein